MSSETIKESTSYTLIQVEKVLKKCGYEKLDAIDLLHEVIDDIYDNGW